MKSEQKQQIWRFLFEKKKQQQQQKHLWKMWCWKIAQIPAANEHKRNNVV